jgi:hypothetical protein
VTEKILNHIIRGAKHSDINSMIKLLRILFSLETDFTFDEGAQQRGLEMMLEDCTDRHNLRALEFYKKMDWKSSQLICFRKDVAPV